MELLYFIAILIFVSVSIGVSKKVVDIENNMFRPSGILLWLTVATLFVAVGVLIGSLYRLCGEWDRLHAENPYVAWLVLACSVHACVYLIVSWIEKRKSRLKRERDYERETGARIRELKTRLGDPLDFDDIEPDPYSTGIEYALHDWSDNNKRKQEIETPSDDKANHNSNS